MATITGYVKKIRYHNPDNQYTVALMTSDNDYIAIFNDTCTEGEKLLLIGDWVTHKKYGKQFHADYIERNTKDMDCNDIKIYIQNIKGIGPARAEKIVGEFGEKTIEILKQHPQKLAELGIPEKVIENVIEELKSDEVLTRLKQQLLPLGLTLNTIKKLYKHYDTETMSQLKRNPYKLADDIFGIGFKKADSIALKLGIDPESDFRVKACLRYVLQQKANFGHTYLPLLELVQEVRSELNQFVSQEKIEYNIRTHELLVEDRGNVYLKYLYQHEHEIAKKINRLINKARPFDVQNIAQIIKDIEKKNNIRYTGQQKKAIKNTFMHPVSVITGGPGTGKTTIVKAVLAVAEKNGLKVALAAPTGKAAKRMEETTGRPAKTIHRLLEFELKRKDEIGEGMLVFNKNKNNPLREDLIIIDEASMIDTTLMYHLISAVKTTIVFIGDIAQLPSIGPGTVLADLIKNLPTTRLDSIFRQKDTSSIIINSQRINHGQFPAFDTEEFKFEEYTCLEHVVELYIKEIEKQGIENVQILTPMRKTDAGTNALNRFVQDSINPAQPNKPEIVINNDKVYRLNDKVMQIRNNYEKECYNGDIGTIVAIKKDDDDQALIKFDNRLIAYTKDELRKDVEMAYAITIHKSQGSEFKTVIIPMLTSHFVMLKRNLIYTAVTRAKHKVIIVGQKKAIGIAVNTIDSTKRYTTLSQRIRSSLNTQLSFWHY